MKKLLLASTSAFVVAFASSAFAAGSSTTLQQTGDSQTANIDQSGGNSNVVGSATNPFTQQNGTGTGGNSITITQTGNGNSTQGWSNWTSYGYGAVAGNANGYPGQSGTANQATIIQNGDSGSVTIAQKGTDNGNVATNDNTGGFIQQGLLSLRDSVFVLQNGVKNLFNISQNNTNSAVGTSNTFNNSVDLQQGGTENDATITQLGTYSPGINPYGVGLGVTAQQYNGWNHLDSNQTGTQNSLYTVQTDTAPGTGAKNSISNTQSGNSNRGYVGLNGAGQNGSLLVIASTQGGASNTMDVWSQLGSSNSITNGQAGTSNKLTVKNQSSSGNSINNYQGTGNNANPAAANNTATVESQFGSNGQINNFQQGTNGSATYTQGGSGNTATTNQTIGGTGGDHNTVVSTQNGINGKAKFRQQGTYNLATLQDQIGTGNEIITTQSGNGTSGSNNTILAAQNGDANKIDMTQSGGAGNSAYLGQGFTIGGIVLTVQNATAANNNGITGVQNGSLNTAYASQNSSFNTANFNQNGSGNTATIKQ